MRLAGTYHPIPYLIERIADFLPGVSVSAALYMDFDKQLRTSLDDESLSDFLNVKAQKIRSYSQVTEWSNQSDIFGNDTISKSQLSIEDEDALNVLKLYFPSPVDEFKDLILIAFPKNVFLKSLNTTFKGISTQEKIILSNMLSSIFHAEHERVLQERKFLQGVRNINNKKDEKIKQLSENLKTTELLYSNSIRSIITEYKQQLEKKLKTSFTVDKQVVFRLAKEKLSIENIEVAIDDAIYLAYNLSLGEDHIRITTDHLQIDSMRSPLKTKTSSIPHYHKDGKTFDLLEKYEEAAIRLLETGQSVNGKNIAKQLTPPVTPPAITDAIKKKKNKINYLLQQYPEKWSNIRKSIRPIHQLDQNKNRFTNAS